MYAIRSYYVPALRSEQLLEAAEVGEVAADGAPGADRQVEGEQSQEQAEQRGLVEQRNNFV